MTETRLDKLIAAEQRLAAEYEDLGYRLKVARQAVLEERFTGIPRYKVGDIILVKRKLFGKVHWWPARVIGVNLYYSDGKSTGLHETKYVSYSVYLRQKDGEFGGSSEGYGHEDTNGLAPEYATDDA